MKGKYNLVFATDQNYIQHLSVALISLFENNADLKFNIYVICGGIDQENFKKLKLIGENYNATITQINIKDDIFDKLVTNYHFKKSNYYRVLIPNFIDDDIVLYLDADIIIENSIKELLDTNLDNKYIVAIENPGFKRHQELKMNIDSSYFNSGVMLINNKKWKEDNITEKVIKFVDENQNVIQFVDQCGLNAVINGNWKKISLKYNQQAVIFEKDFKEKYNCFSNKELQDAKKKPVIIHYTGSSKPWQYVNKHPYKYLYWKYLRMTPFNRYVPEDLTFLNVIKRMIPEIAKEYIKRFRVLKNM